MLRRIALACAALALLGTGLVVVLRNKDRDARADRASARLLAFDERDVTAFSLESAGETWRFVRAGRGWRIASPVDDSASAKAIEEFLAASRRASVVQVVDAPEALASYGLEPPVARLRLEGVPSPALDIGTITPAGDGVFARVEGRDGVLILGLGGALPFATPQPAALRDRSLVDLERSELRAVELASAGIRLALHDGTWWIETPKRLPAAGAQVDRIVGAFFDAVVAGSDDQGDPVDPRFGLGAGATRFVLESASEKRNVAFGAVAGEGRRFATSSGRRTILVVDAKPFDALPHDVDALRDARLTNVNRYGVVSVAWTAGTSRFAARRKDDATWTTEAGADLRAEDVFAWLVGVLEAPTTAWSEGTAPGAPESALEFVDDKGRSGRLAFGRGWATWDALPGVVFRLAEAPPSPPQ